MIEEKVIVDKNNQQVVDVSYLLLLSFTYHLIDYCGEKGSKG